VSEFKVFKVLGLGEGCSAEVRLYDSAERDAEAQAQAEAQARAFAQAVCFMWIGIEGSHHMLVSVYRDRVVYKGSGCWCPPGLQGWQVSWCINRLAFYKVRHTIPKRISDIFDDKFFELDAAYAYFESEYADSSAVIASAQAEAFEDLVRAGFSAELAKRAVYTSLSEWGTYWCDRGFGYTQLAYVDQGKYVSEDSDEYAAVLALCERWQAE